MRRNARTRGTAQKKDPLLVERLLRAQPLDAQPPAIAGADLRPRCKTTSERHAHRWRAFTPADLRQAREAISELADDSPLRGTDIGNTGDIRFAYDAAVNDADRLARKLAEALNFLM